MKNFQIIIIIITSVLVIMGLDMMKKGTDKHINKILSNPNLYKKNCTL